jgi:hypothetical protein
MPTKAAYSLKAETVKIIKEIADKTYRSQSAVVDMAIALLAEKVLAEDGAVDLPTPPPAAPAARAPRKSPKSSSKKALRAIPGVQRGLKQQTLLEAA